MVPWGGLYVTGRKSCYQKRGRSIHCAYHTSIRGLGSMVYLYLMLFHRMRLVLSKVLVFVVMMSSCIGSSIEGDCSATSIEYCDDTFNSSTSSGIAYLKCDFTTSTEDHLKTPRCSTIEKGDNYEFCRGNVVERVDRENYRYDSFCTATVTYFRVLAFFCDISNCKENNYCNASDFDEESMKSTCLCYYNNSANEENLNQLSTFTFLKLFWLVFFGVGLLLIVLPIIMFFNINLVSGASRSFVFFYQCLPLASPVGAILSLIVMQNHIYTFLLSDNAISSSSNHGLVSPYYFLEYFKYILSIIAIVLVLFLVKCNWCPFQKCRLPWAKLRRATRHFREKHTARRTILHGIGSVIVLAYGDLVSISFRILSGGPIIIMPSCCMAINYYNNNRTYIYSDHCLKPKACPDFRSIQTSIPAFFSIACVVVILLLLLPMALIYSPSIPTLFHKLPLPRFSKLHPVFDVFQGVYKDKLRWYAGLHLLYLVLLWSLYAALATKSLIRQAVLSFSFIIILGIHSLIQPYKEPKHNYYESLYLLYLILASVGTMVSNFYFHLQLLDTTQLSFDFDNYISYLIIGILSTYVMASLPILTVICVCCYKCCKKRTCCWVSKCCQILHPTRPESKDEDENDDGGDLLPERLPYHAVSEMM